jgi:hypothetical protein
MAFFGNNQATISIAVGSDTSVPDPQNTDLTLSDYSALTWEEITNVINGPETGASSNFNEREIWNSDVNPAYKGGASGTESELTLAIDDQADSDGYTAVLAASAAANNNYALKFEWPTGRIEYVRMLIGRPRYTKGGKEDPPEVMFDTKVVQLPILDSA